MELPLILSGPILRRVEPGLVSAWLALSKACSVQLSLFEGLAKAGDTPKLNRDTDKIDTPAIGEKLHIAVVMMKLTGTDVLKPDQVYSYAAQDDDAGVRSGESARGVGAVGMSDASRLGGLRYRATAIPFTAKPSPSP